MLTLFATGKVIIIERVKIIKICWPEERWCANTFLKPITDQEKGLNQRPRPIQRSKPKAQALKKVSSEKSKNCGKVKSSKKVSRPPAAAILFHSFPMKKVKRVKE